MSLGDLMRARISRASGKAVADRSRIADIDMGGGE